MALHLWGKVTSNELEGAVRHLRSMPESTLPELRAELLHAKIINPLSRFNPLVHVGKYPTGKLFNELREKYRFVIINVIPDNYNVKPNSSAHAYVGYYFDKDQRPQCCWLHLKQGNLDSGTFSRALREGIRLKAHCFPDNVNFHFTDLSGLTHVE